MKNVIKKKIWFNNHARNGRPSERHCIVGYSVLCLNCIFWQINYSKSSMHIKSGILCTVYILYCAEMVVC